MKDESFHEVFQKNYRLIFHAVLLRTNNHELAEDICQQTFLKYLEYREVVKSGAERGWLLAVAKNLLTDDFRKKKPWLFDQTQMEEESVRLCYEVDMAKEVSRKDFLRQILMELEVKNKEIEKLQHMLAKLEQEAPAKKPVAKKAPAKAAKAPAKKATAVKKKAEEAETK